MNSIGQLIGQTCFSEGVWDSFLGKIVLDQLPPCLLRFRRRNRKHCACGVVLISRNCNGGKHANEVDIDQHAHTSTHPAGIRNEQRKQVSERIATWYLWVLIKEPNRP